MSIRKSEIRSSQQNVQQQHDQCVLFFSNGHNVLTDHMYTTTQFVYNMVHMQHQIKWLPQ